MKTIELIEALSKLKPDKEITASTGHYDTFEIESVMDNVTHNVIILKVEQSNEPIQEKEIF